MSRSARVLLLGPYVLLLLVFFTIPLLLMLLISLSRQSFGQLEWTLTLHQYVRFFTDAYYLSVLADTLWLGVLTTVACLLLGYPLAYHLALTRSRWKPLLIVFILITILLGVAGAFVGGWIGTLLGLGSVDGFGLGSLVLAIGGALLLLWGHRRLRSRSTGSPRRSSGSRAGCTPGRASWSSPSSRSPTPASSSTATPFARG